MLRLRRRIAICGFVAAAMFAFAVQPVAAIHQNAVLDCGTAGTYAIRVGETPAGLYPPSFFQVDLLTQNGRPAGTLIPFAIAINGVWLDLVGNMYDELPDSLLSTCSFTGADGSSVLLVGILNIP